VTVPPETRRLLPLADGHLGRSALTCTYRCGNACSHPAPNTSDNSYFGDLVDAQLSRRGLLRLGATGAIVAGFATAGALPAAASPAPAPARAPRTRPGALGFTPVPPNTQDAVVVPACYQHRVVIRWGEPVEAGAPAFDVHRQSPAAQAKQFGYNNDFLGLVPLDDDGRRALLFANHEYTNEEIMFPAWKGHEGATDDQKRTAMMAHGHSVVELERPGRTGEWWMVPAARARRYNRRITLETPFRLTGPAAGSPLLRTKADPTGRTVYGTLNNCSGGVTPWGTMLSGEENFNQYFANGSAVPEADKAALKRYGIETTKPTPSTRRWETVDARFDLAEEPHEANRFGWIVEVDPYDRTSTPRKHTALGRFKHEGANIRLTSDCRAVAYMGDDERFDYLYKFVSDKRMRRGNSAAARAHNLTLLDSGTLYVAKFGFTSANEIDGTGKLPSDGAFDGTGQWLPLVRGDRSLVPGMSVDEVLVHTRLAADKVGATKMDRPEDVQPHPITGKVYAALTNNSDRGKTGAKEGVTEVAPRNGNRHGHILELTESRNDAAAETFSWDLPLVCGDPADPSTYFAGFDKTRVSPISCPDNVAFDPAGNLWIATDGNALGSNDGLFAMPLSGAERGHVKQFLTVPPGAETCGPFITADGRSVFTAVQHPGEIEGASVEHPASTWPDGDFARPAVVVTWRTGPGEDRIGA
jgi:secreted PhoX family phosphatase